MKRVLLSTVLIILFGTFGAASLSAQVWDFEEDLEGWHVSGGDVELTDERAYEGEQSALVTGDEGAGSYDFQLESNDPTPGHVVTYRVWLDEDSQDGIEALNLFAQVGDWEWNDQWLPIDELEAGEWNTVEFEIPDADIVEAIGFQVHRDDADSDTPIYVDYITVEDPDAPELVWDFEEDLEGWHVSGGDVELTDERAYEGEQSALVTGDEGAGSYDFQLESNDPTPGHVVTYRVWLDEDSQDGIEALNLFAQVDDWEWNDQWLPIDELEAGEWNTVEFELPDADIVEAIGFQVHRADADSDTPIFVDYITVDEAEEDDEEPEPEPGEIIATWNFDEDLGDWEVTEGGTAEHSGDRAYEGDYSARITASDDSGETNFENESVVDITPGDIVTYRVWIDENDLDEIEAFQPFSRQADSDWNADWYDDIEAGEWNEISLELPAEGEVESIGIQMYGGDNVEGTPSAYIDHITVEEGEVEEIPEPEFDGHVTWDFETQTPEGWNVGGGSADLETEHVYSGKYAIAVTGSDDTDETFWQIDDPAEEGIEPQHTIHYRVRFSEEDLEKIEAFQVFYMEGDWDWNSEFYEVRTEDEDNGEEVIELEPDTWHTLTVTLPHEFQDDILQRIGIQMLHEDSSYEPTMYIDFITTDEDAPLHPHLDIPSDLTASNINTSSLDLEWTGSEGDDEVLEYIVYRGDGFVDDIDDFEEVSRTEDTEFSDSGLLHGTDYQYRVSAFSTDSLETIASDPEHVTTVSVEFDTHATWDFEDLTPQGWNARGGSPDITDTLSYSGMHAIVLTAADDSDAAAWEIDEPLELGVQPLHNVSYRVWISEDDLELIEAFQVFHMHGEDWQWEAAWIEAEDVDPNTWNTLTGQIVEEPADGIVQRMGIEILQHDSSYEPTVFIDFISTDPDAMVRPHLSIPEDLQLEDIGSQTVELNWSASDGNDEVSEYVIYRGDEEAEDLEDYDEINRTSGTSYEDVVDQGDQNYRYRVSAVSTDGRETLASDFAEIMVTSSDDDTLPREFALHDNYPNPFNPSTNIRYELPEQTNVTIRIYNITGQLVQTLVDNTEQEAGQHTIEFDASGLASGVYIYRLEAGDFSQTKQMMFLK